jgi:hypothetical protein
MKHISVYPREKRPDGYLLAHNHVRHGRRTRDGTRGFRMFYVRPDPAKWIECACGWREDLGVHYRVRSEPTPNLPAIQS